VVLGIVSLTTPNNISLLAAVAELPVPTVVIIGVLGFVSLNTNTATPNYISLLAAVAELPVPTVVVIGVLGIVSMNDA